MIRAVLKSSTAFFYSFLLPLLQSFLSAFGASSSQLLLLKRRQRLLQMVLLSEDQPRALAQNTPFTIHVLAWQKHTFPFVERNARQTIRVYRCWYSQVVLVDLAGEYFYIAPSSRCARLFTYLKLVPFSPNPNKTKIKQPQSLAKPTTLLTWVLARWSRPKPQFFTIWCWQFKHNQQRCLAYFIRHAMVCG